jgi:photosystem II stability/assembly factor-like uncharacterized protein
MLPLRFAILALISLLPAVSAAQSAWRLEASGTEASLRGIHAVNSNLAWASGSGGTILRTLDGGRHWSACATPRDGAKLDFRAVWAWSARDAIILSSGPGTLSRIYRTTDGCRHWKRMATNADPRGFWDAMVFVSRRKGFVLGDPVDGRFVLLSTGNGGRTWKRSGAPGLRAQDSASGAFAASNTSLLARRRGPMFFGAGGAWVYRQTPPHGGHHRSWTATQAPMAHQGPAAGIFSLGYHAHTIIAVGGDYTRPAEPSGTAAWSHDGGKHWTAARTPPHGYRSAVAWNATEQAWIAAGTNGSDISLDGGQDWQPLGNGSWNALSLPFAVGPEGRIGKLNSSALPHAAVH